MRMDEIFKNIELNENEIRWNQDEITHENIKKLNPGDIATSFYDGKKFVLKKISKGIDIDYYENKFHISFSDSKSYKEFELTKNDIEMIYNFSKTLK